MGDIDDASNMQMSGEIVIPASCVLRTASKPLKWSYFFFAATRCVKAEAATVLTALLLLGLDNNFDATDATRLEVVSLANFLFGIIIFFQNRTSFE